MGLGRGLPGAGDRPQILPPEGEVSAKPTEGEVNAASLRLPPPALRATSPFGGRIGAPPNGRPPRPIPVRAALNPNKLNALKIKPARQSDALKPPVNSSHLVAVERAHGQRPVRRRGVIERDWGRGGYPIASGAFRRCGNPPAIGLGRRQTRVI